MEELSTGPLSATEPPATAGVLTRTPEFPFLDFPRIMLPPTALSSTSRHLKVGYSIVNEAELFRMKNECRMKQNYFEPCRLEIISDLTGSESEFLNLRVTLNKATVSSHTVIR